MSRITINSNIASLNAQRRFNSSSESLQNSFSRLSSGLRINRARDDAAGLAISEDLKTDSRVLGQGIRNFNDAVGLLNIAEGAGTELTNILIRQRELATQAANGTLSFKQRVALNDEANALVEEYNRIVQSTEFNNTVLLDGSLSTLRLQGGYGENGSITFGLGEELSRVVGDGTYQDASTLLTGDAPQSVSTADFNGDGITDFVTADFNDDGISVHLGLGGGTFASAVSYATFDQTYSVQNADFNNDGIIDILTTDRNASRAGLMLGNGDGTFAAATSFVTSGEARGAAIGDFNSDGFLDFATADRTVDSVGVFLGNGDGTFHASNSFGVGDTPQFIVAEDVNNDGIVDLVTSDLGDNTISVLIGRGDGSFNAKLSFDVGSNPTSVNLGDFNSDNVLDVVVANESQDTISILFGNGDGSFGGRTTLAVGDAPRTAITSDLNGDGKLDLAVTNGADNTMQVFIGAGDGTFEQSDLKTTGDMGNGTFLIAAADLNNDGSIDLITADREDDTVSLFFANNTDVATIGPLNLLNRANALESIDTVDASLLRINQELGVIGAIQSRLSSAIANLQVTRENYTAAASQITDVDVASESAKLIRNQILQQAGSAILAQANQGPALALSLLT